MKRQILVLLLGCWLMLAGTAVAQSISGIATEFTHARIVRVPSGVTTALPTQKCVDLDSFTYWYCATPTGGVSNTLCDEPNDWGSLSGTGATGPFLKSVEVMGREFGVCSYTELQVGSGRPRTGTFTCSTATTDGFDFDFMLPTSWNPATTLQVKLNAYSVNAAPTGTTLNLSCFAQAVSDGEVIAARPISGGGTISLAFTTQYAEENATSGAITVQGTTPAAGDHLYGLCVVAAGTTAGVTDVRLNAVAKVFYTVTQISE